MSTCIIAATIHTHVRLADEGKADLVDWLSGRENA